MSRIDYEIHELKTLAEKLNKASDDAADVIADVEKRLEATGIGISCWLPTILEREHVGSGTNNLGAPIDLSVGYQIGWDKVGKKWHLAYRVTEIEEYPDDDGMIDHVARMRQTRSPSTTPEVLVNSPRSIRVQAVRLLDDLLTALTNEARAVLRAVETRTAQPVPSTSEVGDSADRDEA
jgi:hypothetical protein